MKRFLLLLALISITALSNLSADPGAPPFINGPDAIPIDGGISLLAIAGVAYAFRKQKSASIVVA